MSEAASSDPLRTVDDAALYLRVSVKTLYQRKWRGDGPPVRKVGRHLRYDPIEVQNWFAGLGTEVA